MIDSIVKNGKNVAVVTDQEIAFYGDFSSYTSKPLRDFIYESNKGKNVFFTGTVEEAVGKMSKYLDIFRFCMVFPVKQI